MTDPAAPDLAIVERLRNAPLGLHCTHDAVEVCPEAAQCIEMLVEALENLLKCAGRRRPDGHYEFALVPNRDVEAARAALAKVRGR